MDQKKLVCITSMSVLTIFSCNAINLDFIGSSEKIIEIKAEKNTGLNSIYVGYDTSKIRRIDITGISGTEFEVSAYSNLGGGYAVETPYTIEDGAIHINSPKGNQGYIIKSNSENYIFWLIDYSTTPLSLESITLSPEQECASTKLNIKGEGGPLYYYTIDGRQKVLNRELLLTYTTLEWAEEDKEFVPVTIEQNMEYLSSPVLLTPPLYCASKVKISGDRFLREWNKAKTIESTLLLPNSVTVMSEAIQSSLTDLEGSNIIDSGDSEALGGSAPADISFIGYISDKVVHTEWQMTTDPDFDNITYRFNEQSIEYTFTEEGTYYLRFIGSNEDGSCEAIGDTYKVSIGSSELRIPNAFSPNNDGINDVWKIGFRSLVEFKCWIFDSKGNEMFRYENPEEGWDGKYRGKNVPPGVYYYVIEALGADGKKYKRSGDINILNYKKYGESTGSAE